MKLLKNITGTLIRTLVLWVAMLAMDNAVAQDNVGIGTKDPHPSALLEIRDSSRGVIIPQTDTASIEAYVSSLTPNPGIANGLLIYETNMETYYFYDANAGHWRPLNTMIGPTGPRGPTGPTGPTGKTGLSTNWRDSTDSPQLVLSKDTCGDWFINSETGEIWKMWCDTPGGSQPMTWIDTTSAELPIGILLAPDEDIQAVTLHHNSSTFNAQSMDNSDVTLINLAPELSYTVTLEPDEVATVWVAAFGTTTKLSPSGDISYAQFDINMSGFPTVGIPGDYYYQRTDPYAANISLGPDGPDPPGPPLLDGLRDNAGWYVSASYYLEGQLTPQPCFPGCGQGFCPPCPSSVSYTITARGGTRFSHVGTGVALNLSDQIQTTWATHMCLFVVKRRSPRALPHRR